MTPPKRGQVFTHVSRLDQDWRPGPGQKYRDAPLARCVVTKVTGYSVYYQYADVDGRPAGGKMVVDRGNWPGLVVGAAA